MKDRSAGAEDEVRSLKEVAEAVSGVFRLPAPVRWIRAILALAIWGSIFTQLLVFDLGSYLTANFPMLELAVRYRFPIVLLVVAFLLLVLRNRYLTLFCGYIAFFPFVFVLWIVPKTLFRNWVVAIAFLPGVLGFFRAFKPSFFMWAVAFASCIVLLMSESAYVIMGCMAVLAAYLVIHYFRRLRFAFSSDTGFAALSPMVRNIYEYIRKSNTYTTPLPDDPDSKEYKQVLGQRLLNLYLSTSLLFVIGEKLRAVLRTKKLDIYLVSTIAYTFTLTVVIFGFEFFALQRLEPASFSGVSNPPYLLPFVAFSFANSVGSDVSSIEPISSTAQYAAMSELIFSISLGVLLLFLITTSIRERHRQDLDEVVSEIGVATDQIASIFRDDYELSTAAVEGFLLQFNPPTTRLLLIWRYGEEGAKQVPGFIEAEEGTEPESEDTPKAIAVDSASTVASKRSADDEDTAS